jgi:hypothetical protein
MRDSLGHAVETGRPPSLEIYGPGEKVPDYTLFPPDSRIKIMGEPRNQTVTSPQRLSELLQPNQGTVHWAACRSAVKPKNWALAMGTP